MYLSPSSLWDNQSVMRDLKLLLLFLSSTKADNHSFPDHISMPVMRGVSQPLEYDP